jgi:outer membrane protein OmpA-like peptidoglycan-associated protein
MNADVQAIAMSRAASAARLIALFAAFLATSCASFPPPTKALDDASAAVRRAQAAGAELVPEAAQQLQTARDEITQAQLLMAEGKNQAAYKQAVHAGSEADLALALVHKSHSQRVAEQQQQLRTDSIRWNERATTDLAGIATVEQEPRGSLIKLTDGELFASGDDVLLPGARAKLDRVAEVLRTADPEVTFVIMVVGHIDSQKPLAANRALSVTQANAVRDYLIQRGVSPDSIIAEGLEHRSSEHRRRHSESGGLPTNP